MGMRYFTKRFTAYALALYEKKTGKEPLDLIDVGNLSVEKMITTIRVGNGTKNGDFAMGEEDAGERMDNFLSDPNNSIIDLYLQLMEEFNMDLKIFKGTGITIDGLRKDLYSQIENKTTDKIENNENKIIQFTPQENEIEQVQNELRPGEVPKKDENGFVSLDEETNNF